MYASNNGAADVVSLAILWGPRLVRFYFYMCADKALAESSAIETLAQVIRSPRLPTRADALVRLAVVRSTTVPHNSATSDRIARALASLPPEERIAIALVRGMGIGIDEAGKAMNISASESRRLLSDGLLELHRRLVEDPT